MAWQAQLRLSEIRVKEAVTWVKQWARKIGRTCIGAGAETLGFGSGHRISPRFFPHSPPCGVDRATQVEQTASAVTPPRNA